MLRVLRLRLLSARAVPTHAALRFFHASASSLHVDVTKFSSHPTYAERNRSFLFVPSNVPIDRLLTELWRLCYGSVHLKFKQRDGSLRDVDAKTGMSLLEVAHANDIDLEGACEASMACSTCHVILEEPVYERLDEACEDEEDMLDMAFGLTDTSRLGCQVVVDEGFEGTTVTLPRATRNFYVDGHVPKPH